jgi:nucleoside-diphosphate-sugar epimerase
VIPAPAGHGFSFSAPLDYSAAVTARPRKVLVTGGAGLVGSVLRRRLADAYEFTVLDRRAPAPPPPVRWIEADLADLDALATAFTGQDTVIHLAADPEPDAPWKSVLENNLVGTYHVFEAARRAGVRRIVFASSNHALGGFYEVEPWKAIVEARYDGLAPGDYPLLDERSPIRPDGLYGISKAYGEAVGSLYADRHGVSSIHLRIGWIRGDDDPGHSPYATAIWLSQRDAAQLVRLAIETPIAYGVYFATSDNAWKVFSIDKARRELGYAPEDGAPPWTGPRPGP